MLVMASGPAPVLVSVMFCDALTVSMAWLVKVSDTGDRVTVGAAAPVPVRPTVCDPPAALSSRVMLPASIPVAVGVKVTLMLQAAPAASDDPQLLVWA